MVPLLPLRDGVRALPISSFRQSMPSFYMNAPDCICSPGRLPLGAFCAGRDDLEREALHDDRISIRAPRVGRDERQITTGRAASISIHAPRAGCDNRRAQGGQSPPYFNPRAPCGARQGLRPCPLPTLYFNPRAPCGARQDLPAVLKPVDAISIHAPHGRGGVSAGRPAGRRFLRPGPSCAYRARFDCRSGTMCRGRTGCRCSWTYPTHPIERNRTHRTAGHTWRSC